MIVIPAQSICQQADRTCSHVSPATTSATSQADMLSCSHTARESRHHSSMFTLVWNAVATVLVVTMLQNRMVSVSCCFFHNFRPNILKKMTVESHIFKKCFPFLSNCCQYDCHPLIMSNAYHLKELACSFFLTSSLLITFYNTHGIWWYHVFLRLSCRVWPGDVPCHKGISSKCSNTSVVWMIIF